MIHKVFFLDSSRIFLILPHINTLKNSIVIQLLMHKTCIRHLPTYISHTHYTNKIPYNGFKLLYHLVSNYISHLNSRHFTGMLFSIIFFCQLSYKAQFEVYLILSSYLYRTYYLYLYCPIQYMWLLST